VRAIETGISKNNQIDDVISRRELDTLPQQVTEKIDHARP